MNQTQPPIPARFLLYLFLLFFVVPGLCCMGCVTAASYLTQPVIRTR